ncbi:prepilin peptidase [Gellertiella hungarica]|uniref:Prepilin peptidase CpaA n=1 Tax=Gellertiella hungarica TaxID=1572859 RepID=A0A7W6J7X4_9HYPH|nr:prepilin peptidase CpaA [Gellertiella hungarica]
MVAAAICAIFPFCLAMAAFTDLFSMTIPNRISLALIVAFPVAAVLAGLPLADIGLHVGAAAAVFAVCLALFAANVMGGGDAKLLTASALWFGLNMSLLEFAIYVSFIGGLLTVVIVILRSQAQLIHAMGLNLPGSVLMAKKIPYGIAIAIGGFLAYPSSPVAQALLAQSALW